MPCHLPLAGSLLALLAIGPGPALAGEVLEMWVHGSNALDEHAALKAIVADFNAAQTDWTVTLRPPLFMNYTEAVTNAAAAGTLPDILDVEAGTVALWAWKGFLQPLPLDETRLAPLLPGTHGYYQGQLYGQGLWDSSLALITRESTLQSLKLRRPTPDAPWSRAEFDAALAAARKSGRFRFALDLGMAWKGDWPSYAFAPFLRSFGADLVAEGQPDRARGVLNGPEALAWGAWWQGLFAAGYAEVLQDPGARDGGFLSGDYAFSWNGVWAGLSARDAFDDVIFLPPPDLGQGAKTGVGGWQFAVGAGSRHADGVAEFLDFALQDRQIARFAAVNGMIPASAGAAAELDSYRPGGPLEPFRALAAAEASPRPASPGYAAQARAFETATTAIAAGAEVGQALDAAVTEIEADLARNAGYAAR